MGDDMILKTIIFRIYSCTLTLIAGRLWFGDWHTSKFQIFLIFYCSIIYWVFEKLYQKRK